MSKSFSGLSKISDKVEQSSNKIHALETVLTNEKLAQQLIQNKYNAIGGLPGKAVGQLQSCNNGKGYYQNYEGGCIMATELIATKVFEIHGDIYKKWSALGGEKFGLPLTDETSAPDNVGRYNHFTNGISIYWQPSIGAHAVYGAIRDLWASLGWERSALGYPTTDEQAATDGGRISYFQNKAIYWNATQGAVIVEDVKTWSEVITFPDGTALGGNAQVTLNKNGDCTFSGHLHDSGYSPYHFTIIAVVVTPQGTAYSLVHKGHTEGTGSNLLGTPDRNHDWNEQVNNTDIRDNWVQVNLAGCKFSNNATDIFINDINSVIEKVAAEVEEMAVKAVISLIFS